MLITDIPSQTNKKSIKVKFAKNFLEVAIGDDIVYSGKLSNEYVLDDSYWQLEVESDKKQLLVVLQKTAGFWWSCVFEGDQEIDINKIAPPQAKLSELNSDVRNNVEKMMINNFGDKKKQEDDQRKKFSQQFPQFDFSNAKFN